MLTMDGNAGANDLLVALTVTGGVPASVKVKYFAAESVASKRDMTWAGQVRFSSFILVLFHCHSLSFLGPTAGLSSNVESASERPGDPETFE